MPTALILYINVSFISAGRFSKANEAISKRVPLKGCCLIYISFLYQDSCCCNYIVIRILSFYLSETQMSDSFSKEKQDAVKHP